jgi:chloride channel protein, CIC family
MARPPISLQPNVPGRGIVASYRPSFWALVAGIGVFAGLAGAGLLTLLKLVGRGAWSYESGRYVDAVNATSAGHRVVVLVAAGLLTGVGVVVIGRLSSSAAGEISESLWLRAGRLTLPSSLARGVLSMVTVGMGASLGREAAPQLAGAAMASRAADWASLPDWQRRLLVACGAGAGMAAVYNVPLGGALFALEVLLGTVTLPLVLPALATSVIATATAWVAVPNHPVYAVPAYGISASLVAFAVVAGPLAGLAAVGWVRLIAQAHRLRPRGRGRIIVPVVVFAALGVVSIRYPQVLGNGLDIVQLSALGRFSVGLLLALVVLKPLATSACLGSGSPGGLFTPTLACGVLLGDLLGHAWTPLWSGSSSGAYALVGGGAVLAAAMQAPLAAVVLLLELTRHTDALIVPMLLAITEATVVARVLHAPSVYSARITDPGEARPASVEDELDMMRFDRQ